MGRDQGSRFRAADGRLRVGWRIAIVFGAVFLATTLAPMVGYAFEMPLAQAAAGVAMGVAGLGVFTLLTRRLDRRAVRSYGLSADGRWWIDLGAGVGIGSLFGALVLSGLLIGGWAEVTEVWSAGENGAVWAGLAAPFVYYIAVALWEELVFRGHIMANASESLAATRSRSRAVVLALFISMPIFALGHFNQFLTGAAPPALSMTWWFGAAALFGLAYAWTGELALPIGLHLTMNFAGNHVFGLPGAEATAPLASVLRISLDGPGWIVGVGGLLWLLAIVACVGALWLWIRVSRGEVAIDPGIAAQAGLEDDDEAFEPDVEAGDREVLRAR